MKIRNGFVSNSSSSSFIMNMKTRKQLGDTEVLAKLYWGYFESFKTLEQIFGQNKWDRFGCGLLGDAGLGYEISDSYSSCFFGVPVEQYETSEAAKVFIEKSLETTFEKEPERFLAGEVQT
jgi:hypothetical protein